MKATKTLGILIVVCVGVICMNGYAAAEEKGFDAAVDSGAGYVGEVQETEGAASHEAGIEKGSVITAIAAYVVAPWGAAATALTVFSGVGLVADVVLPGKYESPQIERMATVEIEIAATDRE